jgi:hypothetical protein
MANRHASVLRAAKRCEDMAKRVMDLRPALQAAAPQIEQLTRDAFLNSRSPAGRTFRPLALSTLMARKPGQSTKPMIRTGAALASVRCLVRDRSTLVLRVIGYVAYHLNDRNPLPIETGPNGRLAPIRRVYEIVSAEIRAYLRGERRAA